MLSPEFLSALQSLLPADRLFTDPVDCYAYAYDNSRNFRPPLAVVFPLTTEEVQAIVKLCHEHHMPLVPRVHLAAEGAYVETQSSIAITL